MPSRSVSEGTGIWPRSGLVARTDAVESSELLDRLIHEEGLCNGARISEPGCLDHNRVEIGSPTEELGEDPDKVATDRAADATIVHLKDVLGRVETLAHEGVVDSHLAKLRQPRAQPSIANRMVRQGSWVLLRHVIGR